MPVVPGAGQRVAGVLQGDFSLTGAQSPPTDLATLRVIQDAGWLGRVHVTATRLTAEVHGTSLDGCELELFGVTGRASQPVSSPGEVTFSLDRGLPEHAWLWLKNRTRWLDYRSIDPGRDGQVIWRVPGWISLFRPIRGPTWRRSWRRGRAAT